MDFNLTPEQQQFADALRRWIERDYSFEQRNKIVHSEQGVSAKAWSTLAELGMTALPVPAAQGGFDGSAVDLMVVMQELGRGIVVEPYWSTVLGAEFLKRAGGHGALIESARSAGATRDPDGISLFVVAADSPGVSRRDYRTIDGQRAADIAFDNVQVPAAALLGQGGAGW